MRIIMITSKLNFVSGGGSVLDLDLTARTFKKLGHDVSFVTMFSKHNNMPQALPYAVHEEHIKSKRMLGLQWGILRILRKYSGQADVFYIESHSVLYGAGLYRQLGGTVPVVAFFNRELTCWPEYNSDYFYAGGVAPIDSWLLRLKKKVRWYIEKYLLTPLARGMDLITYTNPILKQAYEEFGLKHAHTMITGDPFDFKKMMNENGITEDSYTKRNKTTGPITLFYSSRMAPGKGFDLLVVAFSKLQHKDHFRLILGGTGPEEMSIRRMIAELHLEPYVSLPGWIPKEQLFANLKQVDIFIQARWRTDMTSTSLLFAMAFGLPCILPGGGGLEWVASKAAFYFKDTDVIDLARKIEVLGSDAEQRRILSQACYVRLRDPEINYDVVLPRLAKAMEQLVRK